MIYEILGTEYPVLEHVTSNLVGTVPLVDLPMMTDEEWQRSAWANAVHNFTRVFGHPPESVEEAVAWQREFTSRLVLEREGVAI